VLILLAVPGPAESTITLRVLVIVSAVLLATSLVFVATTLALRLGNVRRARRWAALEQRWERDLLDTLSGELPEDAARFDVAPAEALFFVGVLARYARRVSGSERALLARLAERYLPLVEAQLRNPLEERRARAVQALALFGGARYEPAIVAMLDDPSSLVAMAAASSLSRRESAARADSVIARLPRFTRWRPRVLAAMLARFGPSAAPRLRAVVADHDAVPETRAVAADALRLLNDIAAADVAAAQLVDRTAPVHREVAIACLRLLAKVGATAHVGAVRVHAGSGDAAIRSAVVEALATIGDASDAPMLLAAVDDRSPLVAAEAAHALARIGRGDLLASITDDGSARALLAREVLHQRRIGGAR
jgi:HEAT repeat protein